LLVREGWPVNHKRVQRVYRDADLTRACPLIAVDFALPAARVTRLFDELALTRSLPRAIVCDNGSEFTSQAFDQWAHARGIELHFIQPEKPVKNAYAESFNG
jgi:putative transposase